MSNDYFEYSNTLTPGASARAEEVAAELQGIQSGFELLPQPRPTGDGFLVPFHVATATQSTHAANLGQLQTLEASADASATAAGVSEDNAAASESAAAASAAAALASETAAGTSEMNAASSEVLAAKWAENPEDSVVVSGQYSAKHWAAKAAALTSGARSYQGGWSAAGGTMPIPSPTGSDVGKFWRITVAGTLPVVGAVDVEDELSIKAGPVYEVLPSNSAVQSVNGATGVVVLTHTSVGAASSSHNHDATYAALAHNHDSAYAALSHNHTGVYATAAHTHASTDLTDSADLARKNAALDISAHWEWQDSQEARFGTSADLKIYHNGTNSYIDNLTGALYLSQYLHGGNIIMRGEDAGGTMRNLILADPDDYVYLYSQGTWRLRAEPTGAQCNGIFNATSQIKENGVRVYSPSNPQPNANLGNMTLAWSGAADTVSKASVAGFGVGLWLVRFFTSYYALLYVGSTTLSSSMVFSSGDGDALQCTFDGSIFTVKNKSLTINSASYRTINEIYKVG